MFEHLPQQPDPPPIQPPPGPERPLPRQPKPFGKPKAAPLSAAHLADQASIELFKRTGLLLWQKLLVVAVAIAVISALVGGGIWLYWTLDPFAGTQRTNTNTTNNANGNTNVPLQELDTDKDGLRDIDEKKYGSDATLADTDEDGLNDYLEVKQYFTKPNLADTDGDGFDDKEELDNGYDPNGPGRLAQ